MMDFKSSSLFCSNRSASEHNAQKKVEHREKRIICWRQQFRIQNQFMPISHNSAITSSCLVPAGTSDLSCCETLSVADRTSGAFTRGILQSKTSESDQDGDVSLDEEEITEIQTTPPRQHTIYRFQNHFLTPDSPESLGRREVNPMPMLDWADQDILWTEMLKKEDKYQHSPHIMENHSKLQPGMRAVLMEWLMEVCQLHTLQKETYYLAVDYIDRYLMKTEDIQPSELQLIGITALFLASKVEEIYPPKMSEYAFLTAEACTEEDMKQCEVIMLKALNWDLVPVTVNTWLTLYLQLMKIHERQGERMKTIPQNISHPCYSVNYYLHVGRLLDLSMLDIGCLAYKYSILAASALYHVTARLDTVLTITGVDKHDLHQCVEWMTPFATVLQTAEPLVLQSFPDVKLGDAHQIQCHAVKLRMLDDVLAIRERSPAGDSAISLTPPASNKKNTYTDDSGNRQR
ncbi:hypothetical protein C0Q70_18836 [Pomacea canaliculata]|uniref:Uncharacterized protein n=1 Tax=Pomacea canaliculata TaxID=400727 RepID=A0A2T7NHQ3_POMCA|nr:hypothetical protein C0Q70_18836 [Pomacea canaliculata]